MKIEKLRKQSFSLLVICLTLIFFDLPYEIESFLEKVSLLAIALFVLSFFYNRIKVIQLVLDPFIYLSSNLPLGESKSSLDEKGRKKHPSNKSLLTDKQHVKLLESKQNKINERGSFSHYLSSSGAELVYVTFDFRNSESEGWNFVAELEVDKAASLPKEVNDEICNYLEGIFDEICDDVEAEGIDIDAYEGEVVSIIQARH